MRRVATPLRIFVACLTLVRVCHGEIAFSSDRDGDFDIYVMPDDGVDLRQITDESAGDYRPAWSPSARQFAFTSSRGGADQTYTMTAGGHDVERIGLLWGATWSPDGTRLAGSAFHPDLGPSVMVLAVHTLETSGMRLFLDVIYPDIFLRPAWSPDGSRIYAGRDMVDIVKGSVSNRRGEDERVAGPYRFSDWAPDGGSIVVGGSSDISVIDAEDGRIVRQLTHHPEWDGHPSWSPDGRHIVFSSKRTGNLDVYVMDRYGRDLRNLTQHPADDYMPDWSPIPDNVPPVHGFGKLLFSWGFLRGFGRVR